MTAVATQSAAGLSAPGPFTRARWAVSDTPAVWV